jgi:hypothetical protein
MVDRFFDSVWERIGTILQDRTPARPSYDFGPADEHDLEAQQETILDLYHDDDDNDPAAAGAVAEPSPFDEPLINDKDFVTDYARFLYAHYGRPPQYLTDLFCCMTPIMVEIPSEDAGPSAVLHRFWWLPINHPLVVSRLYPSRELDCGQVNAGVRGCFIIYADSVIVKWITRLWNMFRDELDQELEVPASSMQTPEPVARPKEQEPEPEPVARFKEEKHEVAPPSPPPIIKMAVSHSVSSKKGD